MFSPVLFSIGVVTATDPDVDLAKLRDALTAITSPSDSGFIIDPEVVAFANRHPDPVKDILVEVQALNEDARTRGLEIVTKLVSEIMPTPFEWEDVTEVALAYHLELRNSKGDAELVGG